MEQPSALRNRNKGAETCAVIRDGTPLASLQHPAQASCLTSMRRLFAHVHDRSLWTEQARFRTHEPHLQAALDDTYEYMTKHLDPVLSLAIEEALLYQPDQIADFLAQFLRGTLNPKKYTFVVRH